MNLKGEIPIKRRACRRTNVFAEYDGIILVDVPSLKTAGRLINISEDGLAVHFANPVADSVTMEVCFSLGDERLTDTCAVIWSTPTCRGLRFLSLGVEQRRGIRLWMERRAWRRMNVFAEYDSVILVDVPSLKTTGRLINIGEDGLAVHFANPIADSATMEVSFSLGDHRLTDRCEVIWSTPTCRGLRFLSLGEEQRQEIRVWIDASRLAGLTSDGAAAKRAEQPALHQQDVLCDQSVVAEGAIPEAYALTETTVADDISIEARTTNEADEGDTRPLQDVELNIDEARAATITQPIASGMAEASSVRPGGFQTDWARRMIERQQLERLERLHNWSRGNAIASDLPGEIAPSSHKPAGSVIPAALTVGRDDDVLQELLMDAAVPPDSTQSARDEIRQSGIPHHQKRRSGIGWLLVLAVLAAALAIYLYLFPKDGTLLARNAGSGLSSRMSVATHVVEIVEGEPVLHGQMGAKSVSPKIIPGTAVLRDMPAFDGSVLAPNVAEDIRAVLTINERGTVEGVRINSGTTALAKEVTAAAAHWRYTPYLLDSKPVIVDVPVTLRFRHRRQARPGAHQEH